MKVKDGGATVASFVSFDVKLITTSVRGCDQSRTLNTHVHEASGRVIPVAVIPLGSITIEAASSSLRVTLCILSDTLSNSSAELPSTTDTVTEAVSVCTRLSSTHVRVTDCGVSQLALVKVRVAGELRSSPVDELVREITTSDEGGKFKFTLNVAVPAFSEMVEDVPESITSACISVIWSPSLIDTPNKLPLALSQPKLVAQVEKSPSQSAKTT